VKSLAGTLAAPFPYFGGKALACETVWAAFGDVDNYVEPFAGSAAMLLGAPDGKRVETINDADGFVCLAPGTRLLDSDLRWVLAGDVKVGQQLVGFDEENGPARPGLRAPTRYRHWRHTDVTNVRRIIKPCYRLTFDDGTTVIASEDHLWLGGSHKSGGTGGGRGWRWQKTSSLVCNRATQRSWILKLCDVVEQEQTYEAGWLSGFYDGEGNLSRAPGWRVHVTQKLGVEADLVERLLTERGFVTKKSVRATRSDKHQPVADFAMNGGMRETLRFLMQIRPERLIRKFRTILADMSLYGRAHQAVGLVSKEFLGEQEVVAIETTSHTFVAEGLASHNCNFWRAVAHDAEAVACYADWPTNEADLFARHSWLVRQRVDLLDRLHGDPDWCDAKIAGWWCWGACNWIGSGWCSGAGPWIHDGERLVDARKLPHLGNAGRGVNRKLPHLSAGRGVAELPRRQYIDEWFATLQARMRDVRVTCGDWKRVVKDSVTTRHGVTGLFLDPPYTKGAMDYAVGGVGGELADEVRAWCIANGADKKLRIVLCGHAGEHDEVLQHGWHIRTWTARKGYALTDEAVKNSASETLWCSPHCVAEAPAMDDLFAEMPA